MRAERAFRSPQLFRRNRSKISCRCQITLHAPQAFSASFRPSTAPLPAFFATKRGFFAPNARHTRLFARPNAPVLPRRCPVLPGAHPDEAPACPSFARDPGARAHPGTPEAPACAAFLPARARFHPPCAARTPEGCLARRRNHPAVRRLPARCRRPPPRRGTALGLAIPTAEVGFPTSPWGSVRPKGDQIPGHDG